MLVLKVRIFFFWFQRWTHTVSGDGGVGQGHDGGSFFPLKDGTSSLPDYALSVLKSWQTIFTACS